MSKRYNTIQNVYYKHFYSQTRLPNRHYPSQLLLLPHTSPVTENEVENVINTVKGKSSAAFDEIPEFVVNGKCIKKNPYTYIINIYVKFFILFSCISGKTKLPEDGLDRL